MYLKYCYCITTDSFHRKYGGKNITSMRYTGIKCWCYLLHHANLITNLIAIPWIVAFIAMIERKVSYTMYPPWPWGKVRRELSLPCLPTTVTV